ncbi:hypothetical protein, partial [Leptospira weilii]
RLFTCKKYDFLIEKNLPSLSASKLSASLFSRARRPNPKIRVGPSLFHRGFVGIPTDLSSDPSICGLVMDKRISLLPKKPNSSQKIQNCAPFDSY